MSADNPRPLAGSIRCPGSGLPMVWRHDGTRRCASCNERVPYRDVIGFATALAHYLIDQRRAQETAT